MRRQAVVHVWESGSQVPVARRVERRDRLPPADWRFSQDENDDAVAEVAAATALNASVPYIASLIPKRTSHQFTG